METNRKFKIAAGTNIIASLIAISLVVGNFPNIETIMPVLWWWASIASTVLALYGAVNVIQKGVQKNGEGQQ